MFSWSNLSLVLSVTLPDGTVSQKSKMAAEKNVLSRSSAYIHDSNEIPTAIPMFSNAGNTEGLVERLSDVWVSQKSKMAAINRKQN